MRYSCAVLARGILLAAPLLRRGGCRKRAHPVRVLLGVHHVALPHLQLLEPLVDLPHAVLRLEPRGHRRYLDRLDQPLAVTALNGRYRGLQQRRRPRPQDALPIAPFIPRLYDEVELVGEAEPFRITCVSAVSAGATFASSFRILAPAFPSPSLLTRPHASSASKVQPNS